MQKKKGISLIVLVITIIVMIILAGAIILSLNNAGIINKANEAVSASNEATVRQLAELKWAEAYLNEEIETDSEYYDYIVGELEKEGLDISPYYIQVTNKGVTVEKLLTTAELQEKHIFKYYSSLSLAVKDVNDGTIGTANSIADVDKASAIAGAYVDNGKINVVLLKDTEETKRLSPTADMTINLGGNTLEFIGNDAVGIEGVNGLTNTITIDGRITGSEIIVKGTSRASVVFQPSTNTFIVNGGTYIANTVENIDDVTEYTVCVGYCRRTGSLYLNNVNAITNMLALTKGESIPSTNWMHISGVIIQDDANLYVNNSSITTNVLTNREYRSPLIIGIHTSTTGDTLIQGSEIVVKANNTFVSGTESCVRGCTINTSGRLTLNECKINVEANDGAQTDICGVQNHGQLSIEKCDITIDSVLKGIELIGIINLASGDAKLNNTTIIGASANISNEGKLYIDGVEYSQ